MLEIKNLIEEMLEECYEDGCTQEEAREYITDELGENPNFGWVCLDSESEGNKLTFYFGSGYWFTPATWEEPSEEGWYNEDEVIVEWPWEDAE